LPKHCSQYASNSGRSDIHSPYGCLASPTIAGTGAGARVCKCSQSDALSALGTPAPFFFCNLARAA
jgi:hypothetical protein